MKIVLPHGGSTIILKGVLAVNLEERQLNRMEIKGYKSLKDVKIDF